MICFMRDIIVYSELLPMAKCLNTIITILKYYNKVDISIIKYIMHIKNINKIYNSNKYFKLELKNTT